jgi:Ca-activated chloride channel family protein
MRPLRFATIALLLGLPAASSAQGWIIPRCGPTPRPGRPLPEPCVAGPANVVRTRSDVRVELVDRVLRYEIDERFVNRGATIGEADYLFPLPKGAAFQDLRLSIDGELVAGETMDAGQARQIYEEIVRRQRDPALVEWMGHGLLRTRIFPFGAGEERRVVTRFQVVAEREGDALRVDYFRAGPRSEVLGPRENPRTSDPGPRTSFVLTYSPDATLGDPYSPTHELDVTREGGRRRVEVRGNARDVTLLLPLRRDGQTSVSVIQHAPGNEDGFALITVSPSRTMRGSTTPRDVTLVLDVSGSMSGRKLEQAKAAGRQVLETLRPQDRFRIIDFSTDVRTFRDDFVSATDANVAAARRYIDALEAEGSTNISGALTEALRTPVSRERLPLVLFMTDGEPTVGERNPAAIAARAAQERGERRIFTFGVGTDVNAALIEQLAIEGRGTAQFVRPNESVERAVSIVASRLVDPVMTNVRVRGAGVRLSRIHPEQPLDLFVGQDLVIFARYSGRGLARVIFEGESRRGAVRWETPVIFRERERGNSFVARLWATQRVGYLSAERRKSGGSAEIDAEIRELGERYGIPTEFTSYFVREPGMVATRDVGALGPVGVAGGVGLDADAAARRAAARRAAARRAAAARATSESAIPTTGREVAVGATRVDTVYQLRSDTVHRMRTDTVSVSRVDTVTMQLPAVYPANAAPAGRFEAARKAAEQRAATTLGAAATQPQDVVVTASGAVPARNVGGRTFTLTNGRWTDTRYTSSARVTKVKAYSKAYFALLDEAPELREVFALGEKVLVANGNVAVEVGEEGREELSGPELQRLVRDLGLRS